MEKQEAPERKRRPLTALDLGKAGCLAVLIGFCVFAVLTLQRHGGQNRPWVKCLSNMIEVYKATKIYAADHGEHLPPAESWCDALERPYLGTQAFFYCPEQPTAYGYAMNSDLSGARLDAVTDPHGTPLYFESDAGWPNAADPVLSLPDPPRHPVGNNLIFPDGHYEVWKGTRR